MLPAAPKPFQFQFWIEERYKECVSCSQSKVTNENRRRATSKGTVLRSFPYFFGEFYFHLVKF